MVSFVCDSCQNTLKKAKVSQHAWSCGCDSVSCIDCGVTFYGDDFKQHTQCISEAEKYQGKLFKGKKKGKNSQKNNHNNKQNNNKKVAEEPKKEEEVAEKVTDTKDKKDKKEKKDKKKKEKKDKKKKDKKRKAEESTDTEEKKEKKQKTEESLDIKTLITDSKKPLTLKKLKKMFEKKSQSTDELWASLLSGASDFVITLKE